LSYRRRDQLLTFGFKFIAPTRSPVSLPVASKVHFISAHRDKAVAVWYSASNLPTSGEKKVAVDFDAMSLDLIPGDVPTQFVAYSAIYGAVPFQEDKEVKKTVRVYPIEKWCYAFQFGSGARFRGVISSFRKVSLMGYGWEKQKDGLYDVSKDATLITQTLVPAFVQSQWYNRVSADCAAAYCSMFGVVQRYSPISSLVYMSKKAVQLSLTVGLVDGDAFVSEVLVRQRKLQGVPFVLPKDTLPSDDDDSDAEPDAPVKNPVTTIAPTSVEKKEPKADMTDVRKVDIPIKMTRKQRDLYLRRQEEARIKEQQQQQQQAAFVAPLDPGELSDDDDSGGTDPDDHVGTADIADQ